MRNDYIHITMVIDESGSMYQSKEDVVGGFKKLIDEQKANKDGKVTVSLYTFNGKVTEHYIGTDVNDVKDLEYDPLGRTAMNDGIGTAIDKTGKWLADMKEEERPSKVLFAVFTDGFENSSKEYKLMDIKEKIQHQESKYSWTFIYMGTDITTTKAADELGFKTRTFGSRKMMSNNYDIINKATSSYRSMATMDCVTTEDATLAFMSLLDTETTNNTKLYESELGTQIS